MKKVISGFVTCCFLMNLTACATIVGDKNQLLGINSNPDKATVSIQDEMGKDVFSGETPLTVTLKKGDGYFHGKDYTVKIAKPGYIEQVITVESKANGWYILGNLLFGGLIGYLIVDPATGAMWNLTPDQIDTTLEENKTSSNDMMNLRIVLLEDVPDNLKDKMIRIN